MIDNAIGDVVEEASAEHAHDIFEARCQALLGITTADFLERLDAGTWQDDQEPAVAELLVLLPFAS